MAHRAGDSSRRIKAYRAIYSVGVTLLENTQGNRLAKTADLFASPIITTAVFGQFPTGVSRAHGCPNA